MTIIGENVYVLWKIVDNLQSMNIPLGSVMHKPNFHVLVVLVNHKIQIFGHVRVISDMPLEMFHQTLKKSMTRKPHTDKHNRGAYYTI